MARAYQPGDPRAVEAGRKGGSAAAVTKRRRAMDRAVLAAGGDTGHMTPRDYAIYARAYANGYSAGQKTGELRAKRKAAAV